MSLESLRSHAESLRSHAASSNNFYDCEHPSDPRLKDHYLNGFMDKEKSLTTRNHTTRHDPFQYYPPYHPMAFPEPPPASDSPHYDPYFMSYLRFEQMMRTRHEFYNQMLEKEKAVSMRSVPLAAERERAPSTRSERTPTYSVPFKHSRLRVDSEQSDQASSSKLSDQYERVESRGSLPPLPPYLEIDNLESHSGHDLNNSNHDTKKSSVASESDKYFASPKTMIKSDSLVKLNNSTDLAQLVDNCILPDSEILYPEGRYTESKHQPLGGKLCIGHANHGNHGNHNGNGVTNGNHETESEESSSSNLIKKPKKSFFSRGKSKKKAEAAG